MKTGTEDPFSTIERRRAIHPTTRSRRPFTGPPQEITHWPGRTCKALKARKFSRPCLLCPRMGRRAESAYEGGTHEAEQDDRTYW
jgi:hypothetical protein